MHIIEERAGKTKSSVSLNYFLTISNLSFVFDLTVVLITNLTFSWNYMAFSICKYTF